MSFAVCKHQSPHKSIQCNELPEVLVTRWFPNKLLASDRLPIPCLGRSTMHGRQQDWIAKLSPVPQTSFRSVLVGTADAGGESHFTAPGHGRILAASLVVAA
eukprot:490976-Amphidinium_carterae.1